MLGTILLATALVLAIAAIIESRARDLAAWAVALVAFALLWSRGLP